jgi:hypothetical protein
VSRVTSPLTIPGYSREDFVSGFGPDKGFGPSVVVFQVAEKRGFQIARAAMHAATELALSHQGKQALVVIRKKSALPLLCPAFKLRTSQALFLAKISSVVENGVSRVANV